MSFEQTGVRAVLLKVFDVQEPEVIRSYSQ